MVSDNNGLATTKLQVLAGKAATPPWSLDGDLDWSQPFGQSRRVYGGSLSYVIAQLRYGEQIAADLCQRMAVEINHGTAETVIARQIADEARHAEAYGRYLERLGQNHDINPGLERLRYHTSQWRGSPLAIVLAVQIVLESEALTILQRLIDDNPCALLTKMNRLISQDEARHIAFGTYFLRDSLQTLSHEERVSMYRWIEMVWRDCAETLLGEFRAFKIIPSGFRRRWLETAWHRHAEALIDTGLIDQATALKV